MYTYRTKRKHTRIVVCYALRRWRRGLCCSLGSFDPNMNPPRCPPSPKCLTLLHDQLIRCHYTINQGRRQFPSRTLTPSAVNICLGKPLMRRKELLSRRRFPKLVTIQSSPLWITLDMELKHCRHQPPHEFTHEKSPGKSLQEGGRASLDVTLSWRLFLTVHPTAPGAS